MTFRLAIPLLWLVTAACGSSREVSAPAAGPTYHTDARPILDRKCVTCHAAGGIAPMALTTYDEAYAYRQSIAETVEARVMPPWLAAPGHRAYKGDFSLSDDEITTIVAWVKSGAREGDPAEAPLQKPSVRSGLPRVDIRLGMRAPYQPEAFPDDYRCFVLDTTHTTTKYVTGFDAHPGNPRIVHHIIAYLAFPAGATMTAALDAASPGEGYPCFGGPGKISERDYDYTSVGGWGPGGSAVVYPAGTGIRLPPDSKIVLQMHYNAEGAADPDLTAIELMTEDAVATEGFFIPWLNPLWLSSDIMRIPAGEADATHGFEFDPTLFTIEHTPIVEGKPFRIHSAQLHMHTLGKSGLLYIRRPSGLLDVLLEIPRWDFHWQRQYYFEEPVRFAPGDRLGIQCVWDNSAANQPVHDGAQAHPQERSWGEGSDAEMCVGFFYTTAD